MRFERMKHGSCAECCSGASEGATIFKISFGEESRSTSLCICDKCLERLVEEFKKREAKDDA